MKLLIYCQLKLILFNRFYKIVASYSSFLWIPILSYLVPLPCGAQTTFKEFEPLLIEPKQYLTFYSKEAPVIDGNIDESVWDQATWTDVFEDIEGELQSVPYYSTRVKLLWDNRYLYIAAQLEEPHVWASLSEHDEVVFHDNDFEVFIDPENTTHQYYEIELNALNTIFDLFIPKPYRNKGQAMIHWDLHNFRSAIQIQGTLNDPTDIDQGWTVEMAIPFRSISMGNEPKIPIEGSLWRINFSRVQWEMNIEQGGYVKRKDENGYPLPEHNWVWSPQGLVNMHYPERWGYLHFTRQTPSEASEIIELPYAEKQKRYLWLVYYKQQAYYKTHDRYATTFAQLGLNELIKVKTPKKGGEKESEPNGYLITEGSFLLEEQTNWLSMEAGTYQFKAIIQATDNIKWSINQEGFIEPL